MFKITWLDKVVQIANWKGPETAKTAATENKFIHSCTSKPIICVFKHLPLECKKKKNVYEMFRKKVR